MTFARLVELVTKYNLDFRNQEVSTKALATRTEDIVLEEWYPLFYSGCKKRLPWWERLPHIGYRIWKRRAQKENLKENCIREVMES